MLNQSAFTTEAMTKAINLVPNKYGRLKNLNLFKIKTKNTTVYRLGIKGGQITLINNEPRGSNGNMVTAPKGKQITFSPLYLPQMATVTPDEVQNIEEWGTGNKLKAISSVLNEHMITMADNLHITEEMYRWGAIKGEVVNADGSVADDLFGAFEINEKEIFFDLSAAAAVGDNITVLQHHMADNLLGETMNGIYGFCSSTFFDALIATDECKAVWADYTLKNPHLHEEFERVFLYKGVKFMECRDNGSYVQPDGSILTRQFVADGDCRFVPAGTRELFVNWFAPVARTTAVNKIARQKYVSKEKLDHDAGWELKADSAPGFLATRPALLVRGNVGAA